jgi:hypothetical protein
MSHIISDFNKKNPKGKARLSPETPSLTIFQDAEYASCPQTFLLVCQFGLRRKVSTLIMVWR